jgi:hypothetical protein
MKDKPAVSMLKCENKHTYTQMYRTFKHLGYLMSLPSLLKKGNYDKKNKDKEDGKG